MNIAILPPDVNAGEAGFSVTDGKIRYALTAIKGVDVRSSTVWCRSVRREAPSQT